MDIIIFILYNDTNPCDNMNISLFGQHHNEERTYIYAFLLLKYVEETLKINQIEVLIWLKKISSDSFKITRRDIILVLST